MAQRLLNGVTATTSAPSAVTDGFSLTDATPGAGEFYWQKSWDRGVISLKGVGTGALTFQGIVYLYDPLTGVWGPAGISATIADRGKLNGGTTLTGTNAWAHRQLIHGLSPFSRIALQVTTLTGTDHTVHAYLMPRAEA